LSYFAKVILSGVACLALAVTFAAIGYLIVGFVLLVVMMVGVGVMIDDR